MKIAEMGMLFAFIAAASNCVGGLVAAGRRIPGPRVLHNYMAFGAGFILTAALTEMLPESLEGGGPYAPLLILGGYFLVLLCENALVSHMHIEDALHREEMVRSFVGLAALIGMTVHALLDGAMIVSGFNVGENLGILIFLIAVLHKLPEGFTIASIQLSSSHCRAHAMASAALLGASTLVGASIVSVFSGLTPWVLPVATGAILYVAASDLIPVLGERKSVATAGVIILGAGIFLVTRNLLHGLGVE